MKDFHITGGGLNAIDDLGQKGGKTSFFRIRQPIR
jgi:hypothetical protein